MPLQRRFGDRGDGAVAQIQAVQGWQFKYTLRPVADRTVAQVQDLQLAQTAYIQATDGVVRQPQRYKPGQPAQLRLDRGGDNQPVVGQVQVTQVWEVNQPRGQFGQIVAGQVQRIEPGEVAKPGIDAVQRHTYVTEVQTAHMGKPGGRQLGQINQVGI